MAHDFRLGPHLPLAAVRVFEAAARHGNFKAAADELHLTPSAVSHQVRQLENLLQRRLFERGRRGVELTAAGCDLASSAIEAFDILRRAAARAIADPAMIRISAAPVFARRFLLPSLEEFERARPEVDLRLEVSLSLVDIVRGEADVGVRFGSGDWAGLWAHKLLDIDIGPVCSPGLMPAGSNAEVIASRTIVSVALERDGWRRWFIAAGRPDLRPRRELWYDSLASALDAARDGVGVALAPRVFVAAEVRAGTLCAPSDVTSRSPSAYYAVCRKGEEDIGNIRAALAWLRRCVYPEHARGTQPI